MLRLCAAALFAAVLDGVILAVTGLWHPNTWLILLCYFVLCVFLLVLCRVLMIRVYQELQNRFRVNKGGLQRTLIYGTGEKSIALETRLHNSKHFNVVGFLTPVLSEQKLTTHNIPAYVFENREDVAKLAKSLKADAIIFAKETDLRDESHRLVEYASENKLKLLVARWDMGSCRTDTGPAFRFMIRKQANMSLTADIWD